ncbi:hypothetical protein ACWGCI_16215 [Streptomyces sp. NPDC054949]|uniref:hypothetical protein n=1 Tax=Streptomyces sp. NBC_00424 TaxID=2903648 RepID=UPI002259B979|nr:hypothetical protein [Streptomyces sp. NBC_00424]MCX5077938.1 hypothetical protein [Streptomyces sp. NBC_00424]
MPEEEAAPFEIIDVTEVKPEDVGTLSLRYVDGTPVLVVSGGTAFPAGITLVDGSGNAVAVYTAGPLTQTRTGSIDLLMAGSIQTAIVGSGNK